MATFLKKLSKGAACLVWIVLSGSGDDLVQRCDFHFKPPLNFTAFTTCNQLIQKCPRINSDGDDDRNYEAACFKKASALPICKQSLQFPDVGPDMDQDASRAYKNYYLYSQTPHQEADDHSAWWLLTPTGCALGLPINGQSSPPANVLKQFPLIKNADQLWMASSDYVFTHTLMPDGGIVFTDKVGYERCHACDAELYQLQHYYFDAKGNLMKITTHYSQE